MSNPWVQHVKQYAKEHNLSYGEAMKKASGSYNGNPKSIKRKPTKPTRLKSVKRKIVIHEEEQHGEGLGDIYKSIKGKVASLLTARPLAMTNLLKQYGTHGIQKIDVCRQPIQGILKKGLDLVTGGDLSKVVKEKGYDNVFHLFCIVTLDNGTRIRLDKNQRVTIEVNPVALSNEAVCKGAVLPQKETLQTFIEKGEELGNKIGSFYRYSAWDNNCQKFIKALLNASGCTALDSFIMQDAGEFLKPGILRNITGAVTDAAALADYAIKGGKRKKRAKASYSGCGCGRRVSDGKFCDCY